LQLKIFVRKLTPVFPCFAGAVEPELKLQALAPTSESFWLRLQNSPLKTPKK